MLIDKLKGLPYGGAALVFKPQPKPTPKKYNTTVGFVAAVQDDITSQNGTLEMHKDSWIGAINLPEEYAKQLRQLFKCVQCRSNEHTLTSSPLMKNWIIRKKVPRTEQSNDSTSQSRPMGGINSVMAPEVTSLDLSDEQESTPMASLTTISEENES